MAQLRHPTCSLPHNANLYGDKLIHDVARLLHYNTDDEYIDACGADPDEVERRILSL